MSYQVLARKWRPHGFAEMVGQEHVLRALINALDNDRLHHAYLFTGTRGVGKTTIARILAKSLNCERGVGSSPCGECSACREIDEGRFIDLLEVDAASRTKVDETRELLENVPYAPARGRFKVYLIDEVHMFSKHSFNALLKTLEEPPAHVKFLLATTDPQKLPATILSRCLQFNLKRLPPGLIGGQLQRVLDAEGVAADAGALRHLARAADGSMRDALSLLDQAIAYGQGEVRDAQVEAMLGNLSQARLFELLEAIAASDARGLLGLLAQLAEFAPDYEQLLADLLGLLHQLALAQQVPAAVDGEAFDAERLAALAQRCAAEDVQLWYQIALLGRRDLPYAPDARDGLEMILLRMVAFRPDVGAPAGTTNGQGVGQSGGRSGGRSNSPLGDRTAGPAAGPAAAAAPLDAAPAPPLTTAPASPPGPTPAAAADAAPGAATTAPPKATAAKQRPEPGRGPLARMLAAGRGAAGAPSRGASAGAKLSSASAGAEPGEPAAVPVGAGGGVAGLPAPWEDAAAAVEPTGPASPPAMSPVVKPQIIESTAAVLAPSSAEPSPAEPAPAEPAPAEPAPAAAVFESPPLDAYAADAAADANADADDWGVADAAELASSPQQAAPAAATASSARAGQPAAAAAVAPPDAVDDPLADRDWSPQGWLALVASLPGAGLEVQLASHCRLAARHGALLHLQLDPLHGTLLRPRAVAALEAAFAELLGCALSLRVELGEAGGGEDAAPTLAQSRAHNDSERQREAEQAIADDPLVQSLCQRFAGRVVPGSVRPLDARPAAGAD